MSAMIAVNDEFINLLAEAIAKRNLELGGVLPGSATQENPTSGAQTTTTTSATAQDASSAAPDPWASTGGEAPGTTPASETQDPWSAPANGAASSGAASTQPTTSAPATTTQPDQPLASGTITTQVKTGLMQATFGKYGAPPCQHGQPAVYITFPSGKHKWSCALGSTKRWQEKCGFEQWA